MDMNFGQAISTCMRNYANFTGRACRSEYWWFYLFTILISVASSVIGEAIFYDNEIRSTSLHTIVSLAFFLPSLAVGCRRLHDIGKSGWFQLLYIIPIIGWIVLIIWFATDTKSEGDKYNVETS